MGEQAPLRLKEICAIRIRRQLAETTQELAVFGLTVESKLRWSHLLMRRVIDALHGERVAARAIVLQEKT